MPAADFASRVVERIEGWLSREGLIPGIAGNAAVYFDENLTPVPLEVRRRTTEKIRGPGALTASFLMDDRAILRNVIGPAAGALASVSRFRRPNPFPWKLAAPDAAIPARLPARTFVTMPHAVICALSVYFVPPR